MSLEIIFEFEDLQTYVTLKTLNFTTVNQRHVPFEAAFAATFPAANLALVTRVIISDE